MDQRLQNRQLAKTHRNYTMAEMVNLYVVQENDTQLHKAEGLD